MKLLKNHSDELHKFESWKKWFKNFLQKFFKILEFTFIYINQLIYYLLI